MSEHTETIQVNFGKPMPIFALPGVVLLPHSVLPLHIFEDQYRQMVGDVLDGSGQIALAVPEEGASEDLYGRVALKPAVCVGQIAQHEQMHDGRYNMLLRTRFLKTPSNLPPMSSKKPSDALSVCSSTPSHK